MTLKLMFSLVFSMIAITAFAEPDQSRDHQAVIEVAGVVCSFCAHGTQKNLAKLNFLDSSEFGGDGVLMEVDRQRITLALDPDRPVDLDAIRSAIVEGGYDPISIEVWRDGQVGRVSESAAVGACAGLVALIIAASMTGGGSNGSSACSASASRSF